MAMPYDAHRRRHAMSFEMDVRRADSDRLALVRVTVYVDKAAGEDVLTIGKREAPGARQARGLVERQHATGTKYRLADAMPWYFPAIQRRQRIRVDDTLDLLHRYRYFARV